MSRMTDDDLIHKLQICRTASIGPVTCSLLMARYPSAAEALAAIPELSARGGRKLIPASRQTILREIDATYALGGQFITRGSDAYPVSLDRYEDAPLVLSVNGHISLLKPQSVALIGARNASMNAVKLSRHYARMLGEEGFVVISGLARGIDKSAHEGALATGTVGVSACGLDQIYPAENEVLYQQMYEQGLVITERALGTTPHARLFPARNRIIASLARAVLVVEAARHSGSLITAREAADRSIDVLALPGSPLDPRSQGCNQLIRDGAILVQTPDDVISHLKTLLEIQVMPPSHYTPPASTPAPISDDDARTLKALLLDNLSHDPISVDELARFCTVPADVILSLSLELELSGQIQRHYGQKISKILGVE